MNDWLDVLLFIVFPLMALALASLSAIMFLSNLKLFRNWQNEPVRDVESLPPVSILIPARDEAAGIERSVTAALNSYKNGASYGDGSNLEVVVLDDGSTDETGEIVRQMSEFDDRVRLIEGIELPAGWNGKQHACYRLSQHAKHDHFMFLDADVRLEPGAMDRLLTRKLSKSGEHEVALLSAFPRQETGTLLEKMLIPMMHFISCLCYLPFSRMRSSTHPAYASGCGQLFLTDRESYQKAGTHEAICGSRHDGLKLPMIYRQNGMMTDCIDGTVLASCRMYHNAGEVVSGLLKNASEGIANMRLLPLFTFLLGGAHVLPWITLSLAGYAWSTGNDSSWVIFAMVVSLPTIVISYVPRVVAAVTLQQSMLGAILNPLAVLSFLILQWWAVLNQVRGKRTAWRGRIDN